MKTGNVELLHGGGGRETKRLINDIFKAHFENPSGSFDEDAVTLNLSGKITFTTDSFVIQPVFFPGGDIGRLAVCGTVNDLLTAGAKPMYLSAGFVIEEGFSIETLDRIVRSMRMTADEAGVSIVTGDTKVIERSGREPGLIINTSGIGEIASPVSIRNVAPGDVLIATGFIADHQACILSWRMGIQNEIRSDVAPLKELVFSLIENNITLHGLRDITRGGLATVLNEISNLCGYRFEIIEEKLPVRIETATLFALLGMDPVYMANEGNMLVIIPENEANRALELIKQSRYGEHAAIIGRITDEKDGSAVRMVTKIGGRRALPPLSGESLPRIC
jgi:hydrogenase expression/formation protein HypE